MKKEVKNETKEKANIGYTYVLKDRTTMKEDAIIKRKTKFHQLYINTLKHEENLRRWIDSGKRKKGDIRRSLEGLDNKFQELAELKDDYDKKGIFEIKKFKSDNDDIYDLKELNNRIVELYSLAREKRSNSYYQNKDIDFVVQKTVKTKILDLVLLRRTKSNKKNEVKIEEKNDNKKNNIDFRKIGRRVAAFAVAISMAIFAGSKASDTKVFTEKKDVKSYTDIDNRENNKKSFKESLYIEAAEDVEKEIKKDEKVEVKSIENNKEKEVKQEEKEESNEYLAKEGTKYTESSDGSGEVGYFSKDTKVKVYNRALVKTDKNGNKQILKVTKVGQTWKEFAKENNIDYNEFKEYMDNNKNIQKYVSLDSIDGTNEYGWVLEDTLEKIGEVER